MVSWVEARRLVLAIEEKTGLEDCSVFMALGRAWGQKIKALPQLEPGMTLGAAHVALLAQTGLTKIQVYVPTAIAFAGLESGAKIRSTADKSPSDLMLIAATQQIGLIPVDMGAVPPDPELISAAIRRGLDMAHLFCTVGMKTALSAAQWKNLLTDLNARIVFDQVAQQLGGTLCFTELEDGWWFDLPKAPPDALACFEIYVRPLARKMAGHSIFDLPQATGFFRSSISCDPDLERLVWVKADWVKNSYRLTVLGDDLLPANALAVIPMGQGNLSVEDPVSIFLPG